MFDRDPSAREPVFESADPPETDFEFGYGADGITADSAENGGSDIDDAEEPAEEISAAGDDPGDTEHEADTGDAGDQGPPRDKPPGGGDVAPDGDDEGDPMDRPDITENGINIESFMDARAETIKRFDGSVSEFRDRIDVLRRTTRSDSITTTLPSAGDSSVDISCGVDEAYSSDRANYRKTQHLNVTVRISSRPTSSSEAMDIRLDARDFRDGRTDDYGDMDDASYARAVNELRQANPAAWAWVERAIGEASTTNRRDLLRVDQLINAAPLRDVPVVRSTRHNKTSYHQDGSVIGVTWLDQRATNQQFRSQQGPDLVEQEVVLRTGTGERYVHRRYADNTEQLYVESADPAVRERLRAQGYAVMDVGVGATITPEERQAGIQRPIDKLLKDFTALLRRTGQIPLR